MGKHRIGLIGYGNWGENAYAPALKADGRAEVVAVAARSEATHQKVREQLGKDVALFTSATDLLNSGNIDGVIVGVPIVTAVDVLKEIFETGIPVMYEPPLSDVPEDLPDMVSRLRNAEGITQADLEFRFLPALVRTKELVQEGAIGDVEFLNVRVRLPGGDPQFPIVEGHPLWDSKMTMGSILGNFAGDMLHELIGRYPQRVLLLDGHNCPKRMQWRSLVLYDYGDGIIGQADINHNTTIGGFRFDIDVAGSNGNIEACTLEGGMDIQIGEGVEPTREEHPPLTPPAGMPGMRECVSAFIDAVESGTSGPAGAKDSIKIHEIALAIEAAKDSGDWEEVHYG